MRPIRCLVDRISRQKLRVTTATMWWDGVVPESGQPVLPGDATDVPDDAVREDSNPVDVTDVSVDLLNQIRQGGVLHNT